MKTLFKQHILLCLSLLLSLAANAQQKTLLPCYQAAVDSMERHSLLLGAAASEREAHSAAALAGSLFDAPEVEAAFFGASPSTLGPRWDLSVTQSFSLPKVYKYRARLREIAAEDATIDYRNAHKQYTLALLEACATRTYHTTLERHHNACLATAQQLAQVYQKRLEKGDCDLISANRTMLSAAELQHQKDQNAIALATTQQQLQMLCGGKVAGMPDTFVTPSLPENLAERLLPLLENSTTEAENTLALKHAEHSVALSTAEQWPQITVGYASEHNAEEQFRGAKVGLSIPLWSAKGKVAQARLEHQASFAKQNALREQQQMQLKSLCAKALALQLQVENLSNTLAQYDSRPLLQKALLAGEIPLESYLQQVTAINESNAHLIELQYQLQCAIIDIEALLR